MSVEVQPVERIARYLHRTVARKGPLTLNGLRMACAPRDRHLLDDALNLAVSKGWLRDVAGKGVYTQGDSPPEVRLPSPGEPVEFADLPASMIRIAEVVAEEVAKLWEADGILAVYRDDLAIRLNGERDPIRESACDPLAFATHFLGHHVTAPWSRLHEDMAQVAVEWTRPTPWRGHRSLFIAPRESGKTTLAFLVLPLWALAFGHRKFVAAFGLSSQVAADHLGSLKAELEDNEALRAAFPLLCQPVYRRGRHTKADRQSMYIAQSGAIMAARGAERVPLGLKIGALRPDLILLDDLEPDGGVYSLEQKRKILHTVINGILPMGTHAAVLQVGTVQLAGSIIDDARRTIAEPDAKDLEPWVREQNFAVSHLRALDYDDAGQPVSLWPEVWPVAELVAQEGQPDFELGRQNNPRGREGRIWSPGDFVYGEIPEDVPVRWGISLDPAFTDGPKSDYTGICVFKWAYLATPQQIEIVELYRVKQKPGGIKAEVERLVYKYPRITRVLVEVVRDDNWAQRVLAGMDPLKVIPITPSGPKEYRADKAHLYYEKGQVLHRKAFPAAESEMLSFPFGANDDMVDAVTQAILRCLDYKGLRVTSRSRPYTWV